MKLGKILKGAFYVVAAATIYEFVFVEGMFTSLMMMFAAFVIGLINTLVSLKEKNYNEVGLYVIATIALCMGYFKVMFL